MKKVEILIEALPYIKEFSTKTFVIKYGGSIMKNEESKKAFIEDVALLKLVGINIVIVHGGGPSISNMLEKLDIPSKFVNGLRVTDKQTMEVVEMVLSGKVNKEIVGELCKHGISAIGVSGRDSQLIKTSKVYTYNGDEKIDIGYVGQVESINQSLLEDLIDKGHIPVISPVGADDEGNIYNVNADYAASAISSALNAEKLILLSDVEGLYEDINDPDSFISRVTISEIKEFIKNGIIAGGMIPKMQCCMDALTHGTNVVQLIDGRKEHSLLLEIFTKAGIGTMVRGDSNE